MLTPESTTGVSNGPNTPAPDGWRLYYGTRDRSVGLSDLQAGDRVAVWQSSRRTTVLATRRSGDGGGF